MVEILQGLGLSTGGSSSNESILFTLSGIPGEVSCFLKPPSAMISGFLDGISLLNTSAVKARSIAFWISSCLNDSAKTLFSGVEGNGGSGGNGFSPARTNDRRSFPSWRIGLCGCLIRFEANASKGLTSSRLSLESGRLPSNLIARPWKGGLAGRVGLSGLAEDVEPSSRLRGGW